MAKKNKEQKTKGEVKK